MSLQIGTSQVQNLIPTTLCDENGNTIALTTQFLGNKNAAASLTTADGTNPEVILTGANYYYLTGIQITVDAICATSGGAMTTINLSDSVDGTVAILRVWIPGTAASPNVPTVIRQVNTPGFFFTSSTAGSTLSASINHALTGGQIRVSVIYGQSDTKIM